MNNLVWFNFVMLICVPIGFLIWHWLDSDRKLKRHLLKNGREIEGVVVKKRVFLDDSGSDYAWLTVSYRVNKAYMSRRIWVKDRDIHKKSIPILVDPQNTSKLIVNTTKHQLGKNNPKKTSVSASRYAENMSDYDKGYFDGAQQYKNIELKSAEYQEGYRFGVERRFFFDGYKDGYGGRTQESLDNAKYVEGYTEGKLARSQEIQIESK